MLKVGSLRGVGVASVFLDQDDKVEISGFPQSALKDKIITILSNMLQTQAIDDLLIESCHDDNLEVAFLLKW